jgi:hypothetical protein
LFSDPNPEPDQPEVVESVSATEPAPDETGVPPSTFSSVGRC